MKKERVGITVVGKDREGVVAAFTGFVFEEGGNIEMISQNVVKGLFGMHLEASFAKKPDRRGFDLRVSAMAKRHKMEASTYHESGARKNIAIFVTKEPHCLASLLSKRAALKGKISVIVGTEKALEAMAKKAGIPFAHVAERGQEEAEKKIIRVCSEYSIDLILLARYMRILNPNFVWRYPNRIINIHPSLLPAFPGAFAYAQAHERGTKIIGVTSHYVTENLDQGPIILQDSFQADPSMSLEKIKSEGQKLEAAALLRAAKMHLDGKLEVRWRKVHVKK